MANGTIFKIEKNRDIFATVCLADFDKTLPGGAY